jgi:hypothetical protein
MKIAKVHRPAFDPTLTDHPSVKLTATVTHGSVSKEYELDLKVKMLGITDSQAVILDLNDLVVPATTIVNLNLPTLGKNGSTITWASDKTNISSTGVITRPDNTEADATVKLTATCKKGTETQTKDFTVTVPHWTEVEELAQAAALVTWDLVKGTNTNSQAITDNLVLPATVGRSVTAAWSLVSSSAASGSTTGKIDIATGVVTRPTYTQGQVTFQIACKLTKGTNETTVTLPAFILAPMPMTNAEVLSSAKTLLESSLFLGSNASLTQITADMQLPFRLTDPNASRAVITWSLVSASTHTTVASSPYISLSNLADYCFADVTRPTTATGNISIGLRADLQVGSDTTGDKVTDVKYFDLTILAS